MAISEYTQFSILHAFSPNHSSNPKHRKHVLDHLKGPTPFSFVRAMIRFGRKYDMPQLSECGLKRLEAEFPEQMDKAINAPYPYEFTELEPYDGLLFDVANFAIEQSLWSIFPMVYYFCCLDLVS